MLPIELCGSVSNTLWPIWGSVSLVGEVNPPFSMGQSKILLSGCGRGMTRELESSIFPPFWVLNPNLRSEYLNHSLDFMVVKPLKFYINKAIHG
jgi:hypothetical protein